MATLKHIASKNADYGKLIEYLVFEHKENGRPVLDSRGKKVMRKEYILEGINCDPFFFDTECEKLNWQYHKNQNYGDIKSHHYILSFDPRDKTENGLTTERAQELGKEFARKCFPGHQILICTHDDGHHESGNIHCHIIINSLRKLDVEKKPFMEREIDSKAGYKHNLTRKFLEYMQAEVMRICRREGLHQVELLTPASEKITDEEYRAKEKGQKKLDQVNEQIIAAGMTPRTTVFQTQKQFLRDAILDAADKASTFEEFKTILKEKYGIEVKDRRGRFSYLHPERKKYITGRALGSDFEKEYLFKLIRDRLSQDGYSEETDLHERNDFNNTEERRTEEYAHSTEGAERGSGVASHPTEYDPAYDYHADPVAILYIHSELRLVTDLQTCIKAKQSAAYARKVKLTNLKEMARTVVFIQEQEIHSREELQERLRTASEKLSSAEAGIRKTGEQIKNTNEQLHYAGQYYATRAVHAEFLKAANKGRFRSSHAEELDRYNEAVRYFREHTGGNIPSMNSLRQKKEHLTALKEKQTEGISGLRHTCEVLQTAVYNVDAILGTDKTLSQAKDIQGKEKRAAHRSELSL